MNIDDLKTDIYAQALKKGLYDDPQSIKTLLWHIRTEAQEAQKAFHQYGDIETHYECTSRFTQDCISNGYACDSCQYRRNEGVPQELADVIIMTLSACAYLEIDIAKAIREKMSYNEIRER